MIFTTQPSGDITIQFAGYDLLELCEHTDAEVRTTWFPDITYIVATRGWRIAGTADCGNNDSAFLDMRSFIRPFLEDGLLLACMQGAEAALTHSIGLGEMLDLCAEIDAVHGGRTYSETAPIRAVRS